MDEEQQTLKELLEIMHENDLDAIKVKVGDAIYELVRREPGSATAAAPLAAPAAAAGSSAPAPAAPAASPNVKKVTAPLVGVFYRSAAPDAEAFVNQGDRVETGQVMCILEAMKLFNEITSDFSGIVTRIIP